MDLVAVPRTRWAPSPRAQRLARHRRERSISAFTRVCDALWERIGVARCTPHPVALCAATLSRKGEGMIPQPGMELIESSCHRHKLAIVWHD